MRNYGVKSRFAQEFVGFSGSNKAFRNLFGDRDSNGEPYHRLYTAEQIRQARLKLLSASPEIPHSLSIPPIINCRMSKGGTGKTTIAANISSALALFGHRVLMIDGDPQASLTSMFGINWVTEEIVHIGELMRRQYRREHVNLQSAMRQIYAGGMLDLIASDITLADADSWLMGATNREAVFKRLLDSQMEILTNYDVIVIDSAPGTTLLTNTLMFASKTILAVVWLDGQSLKAMEVLASNITELNRAFAGQGFELNVHIVANGYHPSYGPPKDALSTLMTKYPNELDDNIIPHSAGFMRQMDLFQEQKSGPLIEREPSSVGARAIIDLTKSLIKHYGIKLNGIPAIPITVKAL
jgi:chromosome partitioning protein